MAKKTKKKKKKKIKRRKKFRQPKATFCGWVGWSLLGLMLLPVLAISAVATWRTVSQIPFLSGSATMLLVGVMAYVVFHVFIYQPTAIYVLAHEFTHAIFAVLAGIKVRRIKVAATGGYVELDGSNFIVDLAPYFFPLYSFVIATLFLVFDRIYNLEEYYLFFFFILGLTMAFHWLSNWETMKIEQPDLKITGKIFGIVFILIGNLLFLNIILTFVFINQINFSDLVENYIWAYYSFFKS